MNGPLVQAAWRSEAFGVMGCGHVARVALVPGTALCSELGIAAARMAARVDNRGSAERSGRFVAWHARGSCARLDRAVCRRAAPIRAGMRGCRPCRSPARQGRLRVMSVVVRTV
jgi:hypothetical protein